MNIVPDAPIIHVDENKKILEGDEKKPQMVSKVSRDISRRKHKMPEEEEKVPMRLEEDKVKKLKKRKTKKTSMKASCTRIEEEKKFILQEEEDPDAATETSEFIEIHRRSIELRPRASEMLDTPRQNLLDTLSRDMNGPMRRKDRTRRHYEMYTRANVLQGDDPAESLDRSTLYQE